MCKNIICQSEHACLSTMVERHAMGHRTYPESIKTLKTESNAHKEAYWKDFTNPFTGRSGISISYSNVSNHDFKTQSDNPIKNHQDIFDTRFYWPWIIHQPVGQAF